MRAKLPKYENIPKEFIIDNLSDYQKEKFRILWYLKEAYNYYKELNLELKNRQSLIQEISKKESDYLCLHETGIYKKLKKLITE